MTIRTKSNFSDAAKYSDRWDWRVDPWLLLAIPFIVGWRAVKSWVGK
jgi:hypothetical protein